MLHKLILFFFRHIKSLKSLSPISIIIYSTSLIARLWILILVQLAFNALSHLILVTSKWLKFFYLFFFILEKKFKERNFLLNDVPLNTLALSGLVLGIEKKEDINFDLPFLLPNLLWF